MFRVSILQFLLLSSSLVNHADFLADATSVKMDYLPIGHARVDPILRDDCVSDHVHAFYGPQSGVDPRRIDSSNKLELHAKLLATPVSENTGNVEENKSLYWHPSVYKYDRSTNTYTRDVMAHTSAYYVWNTGTTTAFPDGFRMIGGFDVAKSQAFAECVGKRSCKSGDCYTESTFFPKDRCNELEVSMRLPNCWDGVNIDSPPQHTSHVAYAEDSWFDGECPESHPIKIPQIQLFFRIMDYDGGWHMFSDGSDVYHADYVSGWDANFLQNVLDNCQNEGEGAMPNHFCEDFLTFRDAPKCTDEETCDFGDPNLLKKIKAFQPPQLDIQGTIVAEETQTVSELPRGTCNGSLVDGGGDNNPSPTQAPTQKVTDPDPNPSCQDDPNYRHKNKPKRTCNWIKHRKDQYCSDSVISSACPVACDSCPCVDDPNYRHKNKPLRTCNWVKKYKPNFCSNKAISSACPVACDSCPSTTCRDDPNYRHKNKPLRTCDWVKKYKPNFCSNKAISSACPVACDSCS